MLAYKYKVWTRAEVVEVLINNCYKLRLFDFGVEVKVGLGDICKATQDLMNFPALVSKCALDSFYHSQSHLQHDNRNQRLKVLMRELETIQVEVIDVKEGLNLRGGGQVKGGNDRSYTVKNQMIVIKMK